MKRINNSYKLIELISLNVSTVEFRFRAIVLIEKFVLDVAFEKIGVAGSHFWAHGHTIDLFLDSLRRRAITRNVSFRISLRWPIYIVNSVDKTRLSCNTPTDAAPQFLWKFTPFIRFETAWMSASKIKVPNWGLFALSYNMGSTDDLLDNCEAFEAYCSMLDLAATLSMNTVLLNSIHWSV